MKGKKLGLFEVIHHYSADRMVFNTDLQDFDLVRFFCHYFDHQVMKYGKPWSTDLMNSFWTIASRVFEEDPDWHNGPDVSDERIRELFQECPTLVVDSFESVARIVITGEIRQKRIKYVDQFGKRRQKEITYAHLSVPRRTPVPIEPVVCWGTAAILRHFFQEFPRKLRGKLVLALLGMGSAYSEHGIPGPFRFGQVASVGLDEISLYAGHLPGPLYLK